MREAAAIVLTAVVVGGCNPLSGGDDAARNFDDFARALRNKAPSALGKLDLERRADRAVYSAFCGVAADVVNAGRPMSEEEWIAAMEAQAKLLLSGCGSSSEPSPGGPEGAADEWCAAVPALTTDPRSDLTGEANTLQRVRRIKERYEGAIMDSCPGVTGIGIGKVEGSEAVHDPEVPPERAKRISNAENDHLISILLLSSRDRPKRPLFLDGVRLRFVVTGPIRAL